MFLLNRAKREEIEEKKEKIPFLGGV